MSLQNSLDSFMTRQTLSMNMIGQEPEENDTLYDEENDEFERDENTRIDELWDSRND